jgi:hypothetical protein
MSESETDLRALICRSESVLRNFVQSPVQTKSRDYFQGYDPFSSRSNEAFHQQIANQTGAKDVQECSNDSRARGAEDG